ncbi:hypothetical protein MNBD_ALPHA04-30 [hydrothermal vent metagenome]|uniref:Uncharacterized protein n=1 Tax=hydrothermal vent metagenome TaxID=652676 RepID=A0A3B0S6D9_9ZZZZ
MLVLVLFRHKGGIVERDFRHCEDPGLDPGDAAIQPYYHFCIASLRSQ